MLQTLVLKIDSFDQIICRTETKNWEFIDLHQFQQKYIDKLKDSDRENGKQFMTMGIIANISFIIDFDQLITRKKNYCGQITRRNVTMEEKVA